MPTCIISKIIPDEATNLCLAKIHLAFQEIAPQVWSKQTGQTPVRFIPVTFNDDFFTSTGTYPDFDEIEFKDFDTEDFKELDSSYSLKEENSEIGFKPDFQFCANDVGISKVTTETGTKQGEVRLASFAAAECAFGMISFPMADTYGADSYVIRPTECWTDDEDRKRIHVMVHVDTAFYGRPRQGKLWRLLLGAYYWFLRLLKWLTRLLGFSSNQNQEKNGRKSGNTVSEWHKEEQTVRIAFYLTPETKQFVGSAATEYARGLVGLLNQCIANSGQSGFEFEFSSINDTKIQTEPADLVVALARMNQNDIYCDLKDQNANIGIMLNFRAPGGRAKDHCADTSYVAVANLFGLDFGIFDHEFAHCLGMCHEIEGGDASPLFRSGDFMLQTIGGHYWGQLPGGTKNIKRINVWSNTGLTSAEHWAAVPKSLADKIKDNSTDVSGWPPEKPGVDCSVYSAPTETAEDQKRDCDEPETLHRNLSAQD